jgi:trans-aconitate methyltransferase
MRLHSILSVLREDTQKEFFSILDVGCGYGRAFDLLSKMSSRCKYTGIDIVEPMIISAKHLYPNATFYIGDFLDFKFDTKFDYVICNGIFTQKLHVNETDMLKFMQTVVTKMFHLCNVGISFNVMSSNTNFKSSNLFYLNPLVMLDFVQSNLSDHFLIDHSDGFFQYTTCVFRDGKYNLSKA